MEFAVNRPYGLMTPGFFFRSEESCPQARSRSLRGARRGLSRWAFPFPGPALNKRGPRQERWDAGSSRAREELLRPCPYLGFDHDRIGVHCLSRGAYGLAEETFRRAIWLNPYKPGFRLHLAHALFRQKRYEEAMALLDELREKWPDFRQERELRKAVLDMREKTNLVPDGQDKEIDGQGNSIFPRDP